MMVVHGMAFTVGLDTGISMPLEQFRPVGHKEVTVLSQKISFLRQN